MCELNVTFILHNIDRGGANVNYLVVILAIAVLTLVLGFALGIFYRKRTYEQSLDVATQTAKGIIASAKKEALLEAKDESHRYRKEVESELKERRFEVQKQENRRPRKRSKTWRPRFKRSSTSIMRRRLSISG